MWLDNLSKEGMSMTCVSSRLDTPSPQPPSFGVAHDGPYERRSASMPFSSLASIAFPTPCHRARPFPPLSAMTTSLEDQEDRSCCASVSRHSPNPTHVTQAGSATWARPFPSLSSRGAKDQLLHQHANPTPTRGSRRAWPLPPPLDRPVPIARPGHLPARTRPVLSVPQ